MKPDFGLDREQISILMPAYNAALYLEECLNSILDQDEENWELIVVNDFSEDHTWKILQEYANKDLRVKVFQNRRKGIIPALQLALSKSSGGLITRMDADDRMASGKLSALKALLLKHGKGSVATGFVRYFSDTALGNGYQRYEQWLNQLSKKGTNFKDIYRECTIPSPCWMVFKKDLLECGAFEPNVYPEDYDLCFRFYQFGLKVVSCHKILHYWRDHSSRASRNDPNYANINFFELKLDYFLKLDWDSNRKLVLWGAGKKGKSIARLLLDRKISFKWQCNNSKKWGLKIYGQELFPVNTNLHCFDNQYVIVVSSPESQEKIKNELDENGCVSSKDYYFFC